ncbi:general substrate transporter [Aspergillus heterothallicus]
MFKNTRLKAYYVFTILIIATGGIPKGYDEGGFSASIDLESFKSDFNLLADDWKDNASGLASRKANISSFGVLGAAFGSLLALILADRLGRLRSWQVFVLLWATGTFVQIFSSGIIGLILFARIWAGLGSGGLTVVAPLYLSEIAPAASRGTIVSIYMVILLSFLTIGFFVNYAVNSTMALGSAQYRVVQAIPFIPVGVAFLSSFALSDTPRWLASKDRDDEALLALARLRSLEADAPLLAREHRDIQDQIRNREQSLGDVSPWTIAKEIALSTSYRKRFILGVLMQTIAQWSGGNGITYYIPQIFTYAGVVGDNTSLITSGAYGATKLVFTMVFTWGLVDIIGRRRCMLTGITLQCVAHIYMAIYMSLFRTNDPEPNKSASDAAIASVFIYAVGWSIGLCTVQYLYSTEIYPTRIRSVCYATNMALHWFFQFAVVRVTPNMFVSLDVYGAFVFWALVCAIGLVLLGVMAPETKGVPMERMDDLFAGRWWMGWNSKVGLGEDQAEDGQKAGATEIEKV